MLLWLQPAPEEEEVVEQDVISLKPIGVHALEPENTPSTLPRPTTPRSTTPSFPVQGKNTDLLLLLLWLCWWWLPRGEATEHSLRVVYKI